jgi:hypothetical protein
VAAFLRERDDEPVVLSHSSGSCFPNSWEAGWEPPEGADDDAWYEVPAAEQWRIGMEALRSKTGMLRLDPATWRNYKFSHELSALDLIAPDYAERLDRALLEGGSEDG